MNTLQDHDDITEYYETLIRKGYPAGEIKQSMLDKGYSNTAIEETINGVKQLSQEKNKQRGTIFRIGISVALISAGAVMYLSLKNTAGLFFIVSGLAKFVYDIFFNKEDEK